MVHAKFKHCFGVLAPNISSSDSKASTAAVLKEIELGKDLYRLGVTKVFFKAGVIDRLETLRECARVRIITMLQSQIKAYLSRKNYRKLVEQKCAMVVLRRNAKKYLTFKEWEWWTLYNKVKPLLHVARKEVCFHTVMFNMLFLHHVTSFYVKKL